MKRELTNTETGILTIRSYSKDLTKKPGVYKMLDNNKNILYIGKAKNLFNRVKSYTNLNNHTYRIKKMISETRSMEFTITGTEAEALLLEANLIKKNKPKYNIAMRDDKSFAKILVNKEHDYPRLMKYRGDNKLNGDYYGPFASAGAVNKTIDTLQKAFLIRTCSNHVFENRSRPCLLYQINRCSAPCTGEITKQNYDHLINDLQDFMNGHASNIKDKIYTDMQRESANFNYENAAKLRDRLETINKIISQQSINNSNLGDADVFGVSRLNNIVCIQVFFIRAGQNWGNREYYPIANKLDKNPEILDSFIAQFYTSHPCPNNVIVSEKLPSEKLLASALSEKNKRKIKITQPKQGEKYRLVKKVLMNAEQALNRKVNQMQDQQSLLEGLATKLQLNKVPRRIEVYDNSHTQGSFPVGAMIVVGQNGFDNKNYRKFNIKSRDISTSDDYAMMREVLTRRFAKLSETDFQDSSPDLVVIDGGKGQLNIAIDIIKENKIKDIEVISISKDKNRKYGNEKIHSKDKGVFILDKNDPIFFFL
ncbi:MAG: excinuclease ABC subunit UvrC, partial [Pseudomonadota bacterium]|nr:excinuclease ABC subunit UvrC [Pseudomonadota bacterium]